MKIVLASSIVPFVNGGARFIVEWLEEKLREEGHEVERFYFPFIDTPDELLAQIAAFRLVDLSESCDRLIAFRPPAYVLPHPNKVLWFIHHIRAFYDLWDTQHGGGADTPGMGAIRRALMEVDNQTLGEARKVYTNSKVVASRLKRFNDIEAEPLYPPIFQPERFRDDGHGDEIVVVCRVEPHKRQMMLIEAMQYVRTDVRLRLCGQASNPAYGMEVEARIRELGLEGRVVFDDRWISEEEKVERLAPALAVAYLPHDEDSYGYPSLEAAHAGKGVLTTTDSGGVLELVEHGRNGLIAEPEPAALAEAMDRLYADRALAARMGVENRARLRELNIDWRHVVRALTS